MPAGEHDIAVSFIGYKTMKKHVTLAAGEVLKLPLELQTSALEISEVTTVSQYRKNSSSENVSTAVITKEQIQNTNANDVGQMVENTPGVLVQDGQITIRGGSSYSYGVGGRTAVLTDGLNNSSADLQQSQNDFAPVENVKQVEVIKGASSVIYGSSALDGVVNVITEWPTSSDPKTEIGVNTGVYGPPSPSYLQWWNTAPPFFTTINIDHQQRTGNWQWVAGGNITDRGSYLQDDNEYRVRGFFKTRFIHPKISGLSFGVNGSIELERIDQFFIAKNLDTGALQAASSSSSAYEKATFDPHLTYSTAKGHNYKLNIRYMNLFRLGNGGDRNAESNFLEVDNQYQYRLKKDLLVITTGAPTSFGLSVSNLYPSQHINYNSAIYAQGEFNYKIVSIQAGLRYEVAGLDSLIEKSQPVFRSGINIHAAQATWFRASWGQGYRIPSVAEKYLADPFTNGIVIIPNDTLHDERSWSAEIGFRQGFKILNWKLFLDASLYYSQYKEYVEYLPGIYQNLDSHGNKIFPDSLDFLYPGSGQLLGIKPINIENARLGGYELDLITNGKLGPVGVDILAGYTYTYPTSMVDTPGSYNLGDFWRDMFKYNFTRITDPTAQSHLLSYRQRQLFHADAQISYWRAYLGTTLSFVSVPENSNNQEYNDIAFFIFGSANALTDYLYQHRHGDFIVDIRAGLKITDHLKAGFIVKNLTNRIYELRPGKTEPIRNYTLQLNYTF